MSADQVAYRPFFVRDISWSFEVMRLPQAPALASLSFIYEGTHGGEEGRADGARALYQTYALGWLYDPNVLSDI